MVWNRMMASPVICDTGDIVERACFAISSILREAVKTRGHASLMVSGGSSPKPLYQSLSNVDLPWSKISISLVDERWVNPGQDGSNEDFIRENLIQNRAKQADFFGLKTNHEDVHSGIFEANARFSKLQKPFDVCVMGMGTDAHTASWFPNAKGLKEALSMKNEKTLCAIDAKGSPVAGQHANRISLTLKSVLNAHSIFLFIPGKNKRSVFESASSKPLIDAPVQALLSANSKLHVFGSPKS